MERMPVTRLAGCLRSERGWLVASYIGGDQSQ